MIRSLAIYFAFWLGLAAVVMAGLGVKLGSDELFISALEFLTVCLIVGFVAIIKRK